MTYEEYKEQELYALAGFYGSRDGDLEALEAEYPEYAARSAKEADVVRGCTLQEYQERVAHYPNVHFVQNQDGDWEYVSEA